MGVKEPAAWIWNYIASQGHEYMMAPMDLSYMEAMAECERQGGYLLKINSEDENEAMIDYLFSYQGSDAFGGVPNNLWLNVNDIAEEGTFVYGTSGIPITFSNWKDEDNPTTQRENHDC